MRGEGRREGDEGRMEGDKRRGGRGGEEGRAFIRALIWLWQLLLTHLWL